MQPTRLQTPISGAEPERKKTRERAGYSSWKASQGYRNKVTPRMGKMVNQASLFLCATVLLPALLCPYAVDSARKWRHRLEGNGHPHWEKSARGFGESAKDRLSFSWDTVPIYQQLCNPNATMTSAFPPDRLTFLVKHFPLITLEHCQGYYSFVQGQSMEDYFLSAARQLKQTNSNLTVLFYVNSVAALPYYRWTSEGFSSHPGWRLADEEGSLCKSNGGHMLPQIRGYCWDQRQSDVRKYWASLCANLTHMTDSELDGCSIDLAGNCLKSKDDQAAFEQGVQEAFSLAQETVGPNYIVGGDRASPKSGLQLSQIYTFGPTLGSLQWLNASRHAGMIAEAHAQTNMDGTKADHVNASLATFLIGAYEKSYFAFSTNPGAGYHPFCDGTAPTWCYGMGWTDMYTKPLGRPLSDAAVSEGGMHFERQFSSGTNVTLDLAKKTCNIDWADGSRTVCSNF